MNAYDAIMAAADTIEWHPEQYAFHYATIPRHAGFDSACALGWIGYHAGLGNSDSVTHISVPQMVLGIGTPSGVWPGVAFRATSVFYERMNELSGDDYYHWMDDARICARVLRLYAEKYHLETHRATVAKEEFA